MSLKFMYITNNIKVATIAEHAGVDRIWIDLERLGKEERQKNMNTVKSKHSFEDISSIRNVIKKSELIVRIDPLNVNTKSDVEEAIKRGADLLMLPMFRTAPEVKCFLNYVKKRVKTVLLLETKEAVENLDSILSLEGIDEIHIGLNDLSISYNLDFMFELLSNGVVEYICNKIKDKGIPYGFGGIARIGEGLLPAEKLITEHYRLGSTRAILSRSFCDVSIEEDEKILEAEFKSGIVGIKDWEDILNFVNNNYFDINKKNVREIVDRVVGVKGEKNGK